MKRKLESEREQEARSGVAALNLGIFTREKSKLESKLRKHPV